jgi:hypothetical protein
MTRFKKVTVKNLSLIIVSGGIGMLFRYYFENRLTNSAPLFHSDLGDIDYEKSTELESTMS